MWNIFRIGLCICSVAFVIAGVPIAHSNFGAIRGKWIKSARGLSIASYLGIPYAEQPTGLLRFKNPKPWTRNWDGILDASEDGPACPQPHNNLNITIGREDCLHLNVFVPQIKNKGKMPFLYERHLPILVFIHGGAFFSGSNNSTAFSPAYLLDHEIILVTVNYRLGIFGFLSTGNEASPGNYGIKDVFEALKWIQVNIGHFGGDPTSVTVSGASAGAHITHYLALSKHTEGFFDKIITQSGSATAPTFIHSAEFSRMNFIKLAIHLGCTTEQKMIDFISSRNDKHNYQDSLEDDEAILDCLRKVGPAEITGKLKDFRVIQGKYPSLNFIPTIEAEGEGAIITRHPQSIIEKGEFRDIPWISGVTLDEGLLYTMSLFMNPESLVELKNDLEEALPSLLEMQEIVMNNSYYANQLMDFYFPNGFNVNENISEANLTAMVGDGLFTYWCYSSMDQQARLMNSSVYFYQFSYKGTFSSTFHDDLTRHYGISHGDDLNYLFPKLNNRYDYLQLNNTLDDITMINIMTEFWSSFVKTGIPRAILTPDWKPYQEDFRFMRLGMAESPDISMEENFLSIRMDFWRNLMGNISVPREQLFFEDNDDENINEKNQTISLNSEFSIENFILYFIISKFFSFYISK